MSVYRQEPTWVTIKALHISGGMLDFTIMAYRLMHFKSELERLGWWIDMIKPATCEETLIAKERICKNLIYS